MNDGVGLIVCNSCPNWTASAERGWRAYIADGELEVLCPCCAEVVVGEDEAAWSD
jgi:hypothetical protein